MRILVTGATGFVGRAVCERLVATGHVVRRALRSPDRSTSELSRVSDGQVEDCVTGEIGPTTDWSAALSGVDAVVHLAARVHVMGRSARESLSEFRRVNAEGTATLGRAAAAVGVRRFVFVSSVKVHGQESARAFRESDPPHPPDAYGLSKWEAEQRLWNVAARSSLETVVVRPPLVYGPGVGANFLRLLKIVERGVPLPFGSIRNRRSLIFVGNLADALAACVEQDRASGETFLVSDGRAVSTAELVRAIAQAVGTAPRLLPVPPSLIFAAARLTGREAATQRLCGSLEVETGRIRHALGWEPPHSMHQGLAETVRWLRVGQNGRER